MLWLLLLSANTFASFSYLSSQIDESISSELVTYLNQRGPGKVSTKRMENEPLTAILKSDSWMSQTGPGRFDLGFVSAIYSTHGQQLAAWDEKVGIILNSDCSHQVENWLPEKQAAQSWKINDEEKQTRGDVPGCLLEALKNHKKEIVAKAGSALRTKLDQMAKSSDRARAMKLATCRSGRGSEFHLNLRDDDGADHVLSGMNAKQNGFLRFNLEGEASPEGCRVSLKSTTAGPRAPKYTSNIKLNMNAKTPMVQFSSSDGKKLNCRIGEEVYERLARCEFKAKRIMTSELPAKVDSATQK